MNDTRDDSEEYSLRRQDRTQRDPRTDSRGEDLEAKSVSADKSSPQMGDDKALPARIRRKYYVVANDAEKDGRDGEARLRT